MTLLVVAKDNQAKSKKAQSKARTLKSMRAAEVGVPIVGRPGFKLVKK
eukprot:CAMPEP_0116560458 /NCGR_PEP_ID=MMETSP0397-20121206/11002_1 /TAXON_ID=216820 /ORGANISM="Cyclophora tenuis, Strain ECT3854" /LENGTH=47 /DNA_ID= /DNA_START= /DNA_END= /DNA_ORIENTATION=